MATRLQWPQEVIATAIIFFRRFYLIHSLDDANPWLIMTTCLYLASKSEECSERVLHHILDKVRQPKVYGAQTWCTIKLYS